MRRRYGLGRKDASAEAPAPDASVDLSSAGNDALACRRRSPRQAFHRTRRQRPTSKNPPFDFEVVDEGRTARSPSCGSSQPGRGPPKRLISSRATWASESFSSPSPGRPIGVVCSRPVREASCSITATSHQNRSQATGCWGGGQRRRREQREAEDTVSVFTGPSPEIGFSRTRGGDQGSRRLAGEASAGSVLPRNGPVVRSPSGWTGRPPPRRRAKYPSRCSMSTSRPRAVLPLAQHHDLAKAGVRAVVVMACDDDVIPLQERIQSVGDDADLKEVYDYGKSAFSTSTARERETGLM